MFAMQGITEYSATAAEKQNYPYAQRMQSQSPRMSTHMMCGSWAAASILFIQTGVSTSVSLFVLLITLNYLLLVSPIGLLSLSGLTRHVVSLVGLLKGLSPGTETGD